MPAMDTFRLEEVQERISVDIIQQQASNSGRWFRIAVIATVGALAVDVVYHSKEREASRLVKRWKQGKPRTSSAKVFGRVEERAILEDVTTLEFQCFCLGLLDQARRL
eukprot:TRINITY_DN12635_c0_g1_i1.p1 TRINITY_DN12635_c0_g1~~TRINITY_DN12635_c0_g1_i1.p1  ORF type:complete len:108 (-),score=10.02 TRINITY_DN12635_c0_g1_i1:117-440(-)